MLDGGRILDPGEWSRGTKSQERTHTTKFSCRRRRQP